MRNEDDPVTYPKPPSAEERAEIIVGRLGKLVGMAMNIDGAGAGIALSKQQEQIGKDIRAAEKAARAEAARLREVLHLLLKRFGPPEDRKPMYAQSLDWWDDRIREALAEKKETDGDAE
jgi:hypothetical protein